MPEIYEYWLIDWLIGESEAEVINNIRLRSRYCTVEANYGQTWSIARPLCDSRATYWLNQGTRKTVYRICSNDVFNPLMGTWKQHSNGPLYSNTVVGTLAVDGRTVTFGKARRSLRRPQLHIIRCETIITCAFKGLTEGSIASDRQETWIVAQCSQVGDVTCRGIQRKAITSAWESSTTDHRRHVHQLMNRFVTEAN